MQKLNKTFFSIKTKSLLSRQDTGHFSISNLTVYNREVYEERKLDW